MLVEKEVIRPGQYWYTDQTTGEPRKLTVTPELTKYWHEQGNEMLRAGLTVPVPCEHDFSAHPMTPKDKLLNNAGWVKGYSIKGDALFSSVEVEDEELAKKLPKTIRWTSPWINSFTDGAGREWKNVISHLALTTRPRIINQQPFGSVAAALSMASEVFFATDASGHEHDEKGRFSHKSRLETQRAKKGNTTVLRTPTGYKEHGKHGTIYYNHDGHITHFVPHAGGKKLSIQDLDEMLTLGSGFCLSRAGLLADNGLPQYPVAFSLLVAGVPLATDAHGHEHDEKGRFGKGGTNTSPARKGYNSARDLAHKASVAAMRHSFSENPSHADGARLHREAARAHTEAASMTDLDYEKEAHWNSAASHSEHAKNHDKHLGISASLDLNGGPPKAKPKPGGKPQAAADNADPDPASQDDPAAPDNTDDLESNDDLDNDGTPDILQQNGDIGMEELLCDLLQALGVPMPDESNEAEFKRHLYEAVMSKIKELTSKGMGTQDPNKPDPNKPPDQNKPPHQNPNASHPSKAQPNPLIQQEPQPMFMSLEEINQLPDPMKGVALSMYKEVERLRAENDANKKVTEGIRNKQLVEANEKRNQRIALLNKLSPRAKADLDAMLAQPNMALSMDEKGTIVDPMAQTLAVLEKGLSDLPFLLTNDSSALSAHPQPTDADMLTDERADQLADAMARQMGCTK